MNLARKAQSRDSITPETITGPSRGDRGNWEILLHLKSVQNCLFKFPGTFDANV